jgi:hypothetical protein
MNPIFPSISKGFDLLGLSCDVVRSSILHIPAGGRPLKITIKLNPIRRIKINALHLPPQSLPLRQARHHLQRIAQDHPVGPVLIVLVELRFGLF